MKPVSIAGVLVAMGMNLAPGPAVAQQAVVFQYTVKFVCGRSDGRIAAPGSYFTAINVHNPAETAIGFRKRFSIALPNERPGPVSKYYDARLGPGESLEIDCPDIQERSGQKALFLKGFALIESKAELNVVAVYTAAGASRQVETMDIERVGPRRLAPSCPDLTVETIDRPEWDDANHRSIIRATIRNIGDAPAGPTTARVIDPSTPQPTGAPYNAVAATPPLKPGEAVTVTFYLPYWVFNPDAELEVTADYKNDLPECNENNNVKVYKAKG